MSLVIFKKFQYQREKYENRKEKVVNCFLRTDN